MSQKFSEDSFPIIGMSPGNSYFKDDEIRYLLKETIGRFGKTAILVADVPAIATYEALGYSGSKARAKAILKGNNLKNKTKKIQKELCLKDDLVLVIDWAKDVADNLEYQKIYNRVEDLYKSNPTFAIEADNTTRSVLERSNKDIPDIEKATKLGVHYLLSELAFLEFAPAFLHSKSVVYVYHKNWPVYEDYVAGKFDGHPKLYLDFLLLENPTETYKPLQEGRSDREIAIENTYQRILRTKEIRGAFSNYPPAFMNEAGKTSGIFYELIRSFAASLDVGLDLTEETGYGVIIDGLDENRFDIFCSAVWPTPERLLQAEFSIPLYYSDAYMWIRKDDVRFNNINLNNPFFRLAIKENDISDSIAAVDFPAARRVRVPQLSETMQLLEFVSQDKADATFAEPYLVKTYNKSANVKLVAYGEPIRRYPNTFMFRKGEKEFKQVFDAKLQEMIRSGFLSRLIIKYAGNEDALKLTG